MIIFAGPPPLHSSEEAWGWAASREHRPSTGSFSYGAKDLPAPVSLAEGVPAPLPTLLHPGLPALSAVRGVTPQRRHRLRATHSLHKIEAREIGELLSTK